MLILYFIILNLNKLINKYTAAENGLTNVCDLLIMKGIDVNSTKVNGDTSLQLG